MFFLLLAAIVFLIFYDTPKKDNDSDDGFNEFIVWHLWDQHNSKKK